MQHEQKESLVYDGHLHYHALISLERVEYLLKVGVEIAERYHEDWGCQ